MAKTHDPTWHQQCEQDMVRHFHALLRDKRFVVDTVDGRKSVATLQQQVVEAEHSTDVKRKMIELGSSDHALQRRLPVGHVIDVTLRDKHLVIFEKTFAHVRFQSVPPTDALIRGEAVEPLTDREVRAALNASPPVVGDGKARVPTTIILCSSAGFTRDAQLMADRLPGRTLILVEPNDGGGWTVHGTPETRGVLDLIDPEADAQKRKRIRDAVSAAEVDLSRVGVSAEKLATTAQLPLSKVEEEFKAIATERRGLTAKRMDGRLVLFRATAAPTTNGGLGMPIIDKFRSLFAGGNEKKIGFLAERRTQIAQQLERVNEEVGGLEQHEASLKDQFRLNESAIVRRRLTTQLVQLRKEIDRKAQLVAMLHQQQNVVAAHLHSLELIQQGQGIKLPSGEQLAEDAARAEEVLAQVQADAELADELVGTTGIRSGMNNEEAAMYDELMKDLEGPEPAARQDAPLKQQGDALPATPTRAQTASPTNPQRKPEAQPG